jgi:hypothetical protein
MERPPGLARVSAAADVRRPTADDLAAVGLWDLTVFGADRTPLLRWALDQAPEYGWVAIGPHGPRGYVFGRHGHRTEHVGPLVAEDDDSAAALL